MTLTERLCESKVVKHHYLELRYLELLTITNSDHLPFFHVYTIGHLESLFFSYSWEFEIAGFILVQDRNRLTLGVKGNSIMASALDFFHA